MVADWAIEAPALMHRPSEAERYCVRIAVRGIKNQNKNRYNNAWGRYNITMISFFFAALFLMITPGPGVLSVAGVGSRYGFAAGWSYLWGLWVGNLIVGVAVVSGLAAIVFSVDYLREVLLVASALYLVFLAAKIAMSGHEVAFIVSTKAPKFFSGVTLQIINPKAYAVNTTLFTGFAFMPGDLVYETAIKFAILNALWIPIHFAWLGAGVVLLRMALSSRVQRGINIIMAVLMLAVALLALLF